MPNSLDKIAADVRAHDFDFVIASQHLAGGRDPWYGDYFDGITLREGQRIYLEEMLHCIERFDDFNVVGHIGYIDKYLDKYEFDDEPKPFTYADFPDIIDGILKSVIDRGKGIEVNTSNYYIYDWPTPHPSIIRRYAELGGKIVTTGSDSHFVEVVGNKIREARELIKECGLKYVCTFTKMQPEFHKL
jgi:histidinol-phosphatase (PHP family)